MQHFSSFLSLTLLCVANLIFSVGERKAIKNYFLLKGIYFTSSLDSVHKHKKMRCNYKAKELVGAAQNKGRNATKGELPKTKMKKTKKWK